MKSTTISLATIAVLCVGAGPLSRAADQPFIGKWKLNLSKSKLADQMTIAPAGANRYTLTFAGVGDTETLVADGTDQPGILGSTISVTVEAAGNWKIVRKQGGRTLLTANWKLSDDGKVLTDTFIGNQPDGSTSRIDLVYKRADGSASNSGIPGTWETTQEKPDSAAGAKSFAMRLGYAKSSASARSSFRTCSRSWAMRPTVTPASLGSAPGPPPSF